MSPEEDEPTQTTPEGAERTSLGLPGEGGAVVPTPSRDAVLDALRKGARSSDDDD